MLKKLDLLVIRTYIGPFLGVSFIAVLVLVLQFFWKYLDDLAGKGVPVLVLLKFTTYLSAMLLPLSLPIGVLFSSLFTFGNMGERYELVAIKSSGISFFRFMRPVFIISIIVVMISFWFSNNVATYSEYRFVHLLYDIIYKKPTFELKEGRFYDRIEGYTIYIGKKIQDKKGDRLEDVIIFENTEKAPYRNVVLAKSGVLETVVDTAGKKYLVFNLYNGHFFKEDHGDQEEKNEFMQTEFKIFEKNMDMSSFNFHESSGNDKSSNMLNIIELDSAIKAESSYLPYAYNANHNNLQSAFPIFSHIINRYNYFFTQNEMDRKAQPQKGKEDKNPFQQTHTTKIDKNIYTAIKSDSFIQHSIKSFDEKKEFYKRRFTEAEKEKAEGSKRINKMRVAWHKKFALAFCCLVFFFIGSSLGCITKKGGVALPMLIAVVFFVIYFFTSSASERAANVGSLHPMLGAWFANIVLFPIAILVAYQALNDRTLFGANNYILKKLTTHLTKIKIFKKNISDANR